MQAETDGIDLVFNDDGTVTLRWDRQERRGRAEIKSPADAGPLDDLFLLRPHFFEELLHRSGAGFANSFLGRFDFIQSLTNDFLDLGPSKPIE